MKLRKLAVILMAAVLVLSMVAACDNGGGSGGSGGQVTIPWMIWGGGDDSPDLIDQCIRKTVDDFNAANEGKIFVDLQWSSGDTHYTRLPAMVAAGTTPDLFAVHASGKLKQYVDAGAVLGIKSYVEGDSAWNNSFAGGAFSLLSFGGDIYAVPWYFSATPLFYNTEIFGQFGLQPPATYDDLKGIISTLTANGIVPFAFGSKDGWTPALFMEIVANRIGGDKPYDDIMNGGGSWLDPSFIRAGEIMQELANLGAFPSDYTGLGADDMAAMFKAGEAAMYVMGSWAIAQVYADDSQVAGKISAAKFPTFPGGTGDPNVWLGQPSVSTAVGKNTENAEACIEFLKFWTGEEPQKFLGEDCGQIPAIDIELDQSKISPLANEVNRLIADSNGMFIFYDVGLGAVIGDEFNNTVQAICSMNDVQQALSNLQTFTEENRGSGDLG